MLKKAFKKQYQSRRPLKFSVSIPVPSYDPNYPGYTKAMDWCRANCRGGWQYNQNGEFVFERESDLAFFTHIWRK
jgi:hypothetical protein